MSALDALPKPVLNVPDAQTIDSITKLVIAVGVIVTAALGFMNRRNTTKAADRATIAADAAVAAQAEVINIKGDVYELGKRVDGRLSDLLATKDRESALAVDAAEAKGKAAGEQAQRDRAAGPQP